MNVCCSQCGGTAAPSPPPGGTVLCAKSSPLPVGPLAHDDCCFACFEPSPKTAILVRRLLYKMKRDRKKDFYSQKGQSGSIGAPFWHGSGLVTREAHMQMRRQPHAGLMTGNLPIPVIPPPPPRPPNGIRTSSWASGMKSFLCTLRCDLQRQGCGGYTPTPRCPKACPCLSPTISRNRVNLGPKSQEAWNFKALFAMRSFS